MVKPYKAGERVVYLSRHTRWCGCDPGLKKILGIPVWLYRDGKEAKVLQDQYVGPDGRGGGVKIEFFNGVAGWCWSPSGHVRRTDGGGSTNG